MTMAYAEALPSQLERDATPGPARHDAPQMVIIVDDNLLCGRVYKAMLGGLPCRVLVARSADEALHLAGLDAPERGGARRRPARTDDHGEPPPLFLCAAQRQADCLRDAVNEAGGETIFIRRPVARDGLTSLVRRHLSSRR